jgi:heterodisulfide reductase subunit A
VERRAVVIGGGATGMTAAHALAARDIPAVLIEKEDKLGGLLNSVNLLYPGYCDASKYAEELSNTLAADSRVEVLAKTSVTAVSGHAGAYTLTVETAGKPRELSAGCVVVATGANVLTPEGLFGYGANPNVVTQLEFEAMLRKGLGDVKSIVMIQCAGSRNAERPYCSRVCCTATVKNTVTVIESVPDAAITVLSRGFAEYVGDLDRARDSGVTFLRYDLERPPSVGPETVDVFDMISSAEKSIPYDLVVLATPLVARDETAELARLLNLPADDHGFVAEPHTKLRPAAYAPGGVFVAGSAHWPATVTECLSQAHGAAARAAALLERGTIEREPLVAVVDELTCRGCERCVEACAHGAPALMDSDDGMKTSSIDTIRCVGCGVCVAVCPSSAITLSHLTSEQLLAMVGAAAGA